MLVRWVVVALWTAERRRRSRMQVLEAGWEVAVRVAVTEAESVVRRTAVALEEEEGGAGSVDGSKCVGIGSGRCTGSMGAGQQSCLPDCSAYGAKP